ncbi:MAG: hypothetical protein OES79_16995, partial [Planctomycetota bacterium]|nr:hypothetical protein [Planctomycetota bacterium]
SQQIRLLYDHATELHIPLREDCQILTPKLVTVTRKLDPSLEGKVAGNVRSVTERYLQYSYAIVTTKSLGSFGSGQFARFETRQGGTLVMDENWNDRKLVNDPVVYHDDFSGNGDREPCVPSLQRALERFQKLNRVSFKNARLRHQITDDDLTIVGSSGHPFSVTRASSRDPFRVVWGRCNLADHIRGVGHTGKDCSFFSEV